MISEHIIKEAQSSNAWHQVANQISSTSFLERLHASPQSGKEGKRDQREYPCENEEYLCFTGSLKGAWQMQADLSEAPSLHGNSRGYRLVMTVCHGQQVMILEYLIWNCRGIAPTKHYKPIC